MDLSRSVCESEAKLKKKKEKKFTLYIYGLGMIEKLKAVFNLFLQLDRCLIGIKTGNFPLTINNFLVKSDQNNNNTKHTLNRHNIPYI